MKRTKKVEFWVSLTVLMAAVLSAMACNQPGTASSAAAAPGTTTTSGTPIIPVGEALPSSSAAWSFGILSDTQWVGQDDGKNPNTAATGIIAQVDQQFIAKGVKLVVAVGDLMDATSTDTASDGTKITSTPAQNEDVRATYAQDLYNAGIGFFPLRGNHDDYPAVASEFVRLFPQTQNGVNNATPTSAFLVQATNPGAAADPNWAPSSVTGAPFTIGSSFSSPPSATSDLNGLSYAFDYNNVRFVLLDQFTPADKPTGAENPVSAQLPWVKTVLSGRAAKSHAFVFAHKGLITENHADVLFGNDPTVDPASQNTFIGYLQTYGVHYYIGGHDHMHDHTIVNSDDGTVSTPASAHVTELVCASDSSKFYTPYANNGNQSLSNDQYYAQAAGTSTRQTPLSQELNTIGYYIVTVNGSQVTVDYYSAPITVSGGLITATPALNFSKRETFGYSLNGKEFVVAQGAGYTSVKDSYQGSLGSAPTTLALLGGKNANTSVDGNNRAQSLAVDTGWVTKTQGLYSDIVTLTGLSYTLGSANTDPIPVAVSYSGTPTSTTGGFGLVRINAAGTAWVNAVNENSGGSAKFVNGPWTSAYGLGTYGIDTTTTPATAWAVVNKAGSFAVGPITQ